MSQHNSHCIKQWKDFKSNVYNCDWHMHDVGCGMSTCESHHVACATYVILLLVYPGPVIPQEFWAMYCAHDHQWIPCDDTGAS